MMSEKKNGVTTDSASFNIPALIERFPANAETMLIDMRLTDEPAASSRLFRFYRPVPLHYHKTCDEYLLVVRGRARFCVGTDNLVLGPGQLLFFKRGTPHGVLEIFEEPLVVYSVDTPRRDPADVTFVDPNSGTAESFIRSIKL
jgi:mannose-6-phosphate isomerase-like protein (cupin superfamily)